MTGIRKTIASAVKAAINTVRQIEQADTQAAPLFNVTSAISGAHLGTIHAPTPSEARLAATEMYGVPTRVW
jgi:hypothetical protein